MFRSLKAASVLFLLPALLFVLSAVFLESKESPSPGQKLFETNCLQCHGVDGRGSMPAAKSLKIDPLQLDLTRDWVIQESAADLEKRVSDGHGKMPKQGAKFTSLEIRSLIRYIRSLQRAFASMR
jgi:cytochrome c oxidase cbb3-type subunit III